MPYTKRPRPAARAGFTMIEILAVVVIIGISAAVIIPQISSRDDLKADSLARVVMADVLYAQNRAVATQKVHYVRFDKAAQRYDVLERMTPTEALVLHPVSQNPFQVPTGSSRTDGLKTVQLDAVSFDGQSVLAFDELGTPHAYNTTTLTMSAMTAGSITLRCGTHTVVINIEPFSGELTAN